VHHSHAVLLSPIRASEFLFVWVISEGREVARSADIYLMGSTSLLTKGAGDLIGV